MRLARWKGRELREVEFGELRMNSITREVRSCSLWSTVSCLLGGVGPSATCETLRCESALLGIEYLVTHKNRPQASRSDRGSKEKRISMQQEQQYVKHESLQPQRDDLFYKGFMLSVVATLDPSLLCETSIENF